ncbi:adenosylmethionine-8-amino-7-oxononanoate aminotransferase [bacterium]|nr:adenosylmethionine-8-amino-7-oxononanoate aminotransferase [bacterium]
MAKQKTLTRPKKKLLGICVTGTVVKIGSKGQLITDITNESLSEAGQDDSVTVKFADHETIGVYPEDHGQPDATLVASCGSSGCLEIEIVGISISEMLGIKAGIPVSVSF